MRGKRGGRPVRRSARRRKRLPRADRALHDVLQSLPIGLHLYTLRRGGRLVFIGANPAADRILGVENAAFIGRTIEEAFPPLAATEIPERYRRVAREGRAWRAERFEYDHGGIRGTFDIHAVPLGRGRMAALFSDVTARHRAEREIEAEHRRFLALFEGARDALVLVDAATGAILDANREAERLAGRTRGDLVGRPFDVLHPPEEAERCRVAFQELVASGEGGAFETLLLARDGRRIPVEIRASLVDLGPGLRVVQGSFLDLTERKEAEARMRAMAAEWQVTFDAVTDVVCTLDAEQRIRRCNRAAAQFLRRDERDLLGRRCVEVFHGGTPPAGCPIARMRETRRRETMELPLGDRWYRVVVDPMFDGAGLLTGAVHLLQDITDLKRSAEALRAVRDRTQRYLDVAGVLLVALDTRGAVTLVNRKGCEVLGRTEAAIIGQDWFNRFIPERHRAQARAVFNRLMAGQVEPAEFFENTVLTGCGEERLIAWRNTLLRDEAGRIVGTLSSGEDVTDRRRSETALVASEAKLRAMLRAAPVGIGIVVNRSFQSVNERLCSLVGYAEPELLGRSARMLYPTDAEYESVGRVKYGEMAKRGVGTVETRWRRKDGAILDILLSSAPLDPDDLRRGVVFTALDITDRKRAEAALREKTEEIDRYFASSLDLICIADTDGFFRRLNPAWERTLGYPLAELEGKRFLDFVHPDDIAATREAVARLAGQQEILNFVNRYRRRDGSYRWLEWRSIPQGRTIYATARDITERREAEAALKAAEERYLHAQKMESIGRLAGGVAHDFNNLLTVIASSAELLQAEVADRPGAAERVEQIRMAARRAADLTRQLLVFGRRQPVRPERLDLGRVLADTSRLLQRLIGEDVRLETAFAPSPLGVVADPGQLVQVLMNLAVNARDAMPSGGTLALETARVALDADAAARIPDGRPGDFARIVVRDTGAGMSPEVRARLFEPFFTTKEVGKGTGLGLATVYGIVRQSEGFLDVESEPGRGTVFRIFLPLHDAPADAASAAEGPPPPARPARGTERVLVAEDDPSVRLLLVEILRAHGYSVLEAELPDRALQLAASAAPQLLVTDYVMPQMSGRELARRLAGDHPRMRVLFISGYTDGTADLKDDPSAGQFFLPKPFSPDALLRKVREVLDAEG